MFWFTLFERIRYYLLLLMCNIGSVFEESSYRAIQQYNMLCSMKHRSGKSLCETGDEPFLANIIKSSFIDNASNGSYNFDQDPQ